MADAEIFVTMTAKLAPLRAFRAMDQSFTVEEGLHAGQGERLRLLLDEGSEDVGAQGHGTAKEPRGLPPFVFLPEGFQLTHMLGS